MGSLRGQRDQSPYHRSHPHTVGVVGVKFGRSRIGRVNLVEVKFGRSRINSLDW